MRVLTIIAILIASAIGYVQAQQAPAPPAQSCEQQLDNAQRVILQLRKQAAQAEFQNVTLQESLLDQQKKQAEADQKGKAAEKK
jgi:hypothetical protein